MKQHCGGGDDDGDDDHDLRKWEGHDGTWYGDDDDLAGSKTPGVVGGVVQHYVG